MAANIIMGKAMKITSPAEHADWHVVRMLAAAL